AVWWPQRPGGRHRPGRRRGHGRARRHLCDRRAQPALRVQSQAVSALLRPLSIAAPWAGGIKFRLRLAVHSVARPISRECMMRPTLKWTLVVLAGAALLLAVALAQYFRFFEQ